MINNKNKLLFCSLDNALLGMYYIICILCIYYYHSLSIFDLLNVLNQIENYIARIRFGEFNIYRARSCETLLRVSIICILHGIVLVARIIH